MAAGRIEHKLELGQRAGNQRLVDGFADPLAEVDRLDVAIIAAGLVFGHRLGAGPLDDAWRMRSRDPLALAIAGADARCRRLLLGGTPVPVIRALGHAHLIPGLHGLRTRHETVSSVGTNPGMARDRSRLNPRPEGLRR